MDPILQSYARGGQISSLELDGLSVSSAFMPRFEAFLDALLTPSAMKRTLKKLCIGHHWAKLFRQSTADVMKRVLNDPLMIDYLHLYRCETPRAGTRAMFGERAPEVEKIQWDVASDEGEVIPAPGVPPVALLVAFASVIRHLQKRGKFAGLDNDVVATVFEFIGKTKQRVVITQANILYEVRPQA